MIRRLKSRAVNRETPRARGATNAQKSIMLSLYEGWLLRHVDKHGWCLFQPRRERPFARVRTSIIDEMTEKGWLSPGTALKGLGMRPAKDLTPVGFRYAERLARKHWAEEMTWEPAPATGRNTMSLNGTPFNSFLAEDEAPATFRRAA